MIAEASNLAATSTQRRDANGNSAAPHSDDRTFDTLMATLQAAYGTRACTIAATLHHGADPSGNSDDSHGARLQEMTEARNTESAGPRSRLGAGQQGGEGPRAQRLELERDQLSRSTETESARRGARTENAKPQDQRTTPAREPSVRVDDSTHRSPRPAPPVQQTGAPPAKGMQPQPGKTRGFAKLCNPSVGEQQPARPVKPVQTTNPVASPAAPATAQSPAEQIVRLLTESGKGGQQGLRAVNAAESTTAPKATTGHANQDARIAQQASKQKGRAASSQSNRGQQAESSRRSGFDQLVRSLRMNIGRNRSTARLHLNPPELGRIQIDARLEGQRLEVMVKVETQAARDVLQSRGADLQAALEQHGIRVERFEFSASNQQGQGQVANQQFGTPSEGSADPDGRGFTDDSSSETDSRTRNGVSPTVASAASEPIADATPANLGVAAETRLDVRI